MTTGNGIDLALGTLTQTIIGVTFGSSNLMCQQPIDGNEIGLAWGVPWPLACELLDAGEPVGGHHQPVRQCGCHKMAQQDNRSGLGGSRAAMERARGVQSHGDTEWRLACGVPWEEEVWSNEVSVSSSYIYMLSVDGPLMGLRLAR